MAKKGLPPIPGHVGPGTHGDLCAPLGTRIPLAFLARKACLASLRGGLCTLSSTWSCPVASLQ